MVDTIVKAGNRYAQTAEGKRISRKKLLADMIWNASLSGEVTFFATNRAGGEDRTVPLSPSEWIGFVREILEHIDGRLSISMKITDEEPEPDRSPQVNLGPVLYIPENGRDKDDE